MQSDEVVGSSQGDHTTITGALDCEFLTDGNTIEVQESYYNQLVLANPASFPGVDPYLTVYNEDITFPDDKNISIIAAPTLSSSSLTDRELVIEIRGTWAPGLTRRPVVTFPTKASTRDSVLDGFLITGGTGGIDPRLGLVNAGVLTGGGIQCLGASPTISNCTIERNQAMLGGGIYADLEDGEGDPAAFLDGPLIEDCVIESNKAFELTGSGTYSATGAGLFALNCSPVILRTLFVENESDYAGGGIGLQNDLFEGEAPVLTTPHIADCEIRDNRAQLEGGGIAGYIAVNASIQRCLITDNAVTDQGSSPPLGVGGGLFWRACKFDIALCYIGYNTAAEAGAGLAYQQEQDFSNSGVSGLVGSTITHTTIARNQTTNVTILAKGGGVWGSGNSADYLVTTRFENCLIALNKSQNGAGVTIEGSRASFQNVTVSQNTATGLGKDGAGGVLFDENSSTNAIVSFQDCILAENLQRTAPPTNPWELDFKDATVTGFETPGAIAFNSCLLPSGVPPLTSGVGNLVAQANFAVGLSWTHFPIHGFYLSHSPEQASTSAAYNSGSQLIGPQLAVNGMRCRTSSGVVDFNIVDMGFHYPNDITGLPDLGGNP